jgi:two-component sensor histidine kinase
LLKDLEETWSTPEAPRSITLSAEPVSLDTDKAVAVGVIVNELVSNACKYAYPEDRAGEVRVALLNQGGGFLLRVEDDGLGMPSDGSIKGTGLGSKLVNAMAANLRAQLDHDPTHQGVRITVSVPA